MTSLNMFVSLLNKAGIKTVLVKNFSNKNTPISYSLQVLNDKDNVVSSVSITKEEFTKIMKELD